MITTSDDLVGIFRREVDDLPQQNGSTAGSLWSDDDIYRYMNSAANMTARRVMSLYKIFELDITAGEGLIKFPTERILKVRRAYSITGRREIRQLNMSDSYIIDDYGLSVRSATWETTTGPPNSFALDYRPGYLRLFPIPTANDTLVVHAHVIPAIMVPGDTVPFTADEDISLVLMWMKKLAYDKHDADTFDAGKSQRFEAEFERRVREREPEFRRQTRSPGVVRGIW